MTDFEEFIKVNNITKKSIARYLNVTPAFITQLVQGKRSIPLDKIEAIKANKAWDTSMFSLTKDNWIVSDHIYHSEKYDTKSLHDVGLRISLVSEMKKMDYQSFAKRIGADYADLAAVAAAQKPATDALLIKIMVAFPDINPYWLATGQSTPIIKDVVPDLAINELPDRLEAAEKQIKEKDYIISLQKDTIESHKKQIALLEEKTAVMHYTAPSKNAASSKGKTAGASGITLG